MAHEPRAWIERVAAASARRPMTAILAWAVGTVVAVVLVATLLGDTLTTDANFTNDPEAKRANELVEDRLRGPDHPVELVVVRGAPGSADGPDLPAVVGEIAQDVRGLGPEVVASVASFYDTGNAAFVSADRDAVLIRIVMAGDDNSAADDVALVHALSVEREVPAGIEVAQAGEATLSHDFSRISEEDLAKGEAIGVPIALVVLLAVFGAVVAALVPLGLAVVAILVALGLVALVGTVWDFSFFVVNMITMMGLAVGIDYSLFIVSRYREERAHGRDTMGAIAASAQTASRAVFFSAMTVVLALLGMLLIPTTIFRSLAAGAIFVVLAALAATLTLLPAALSLLGDRVNRLRVPIVGRRVTSGAEAGPFWDTASRLVMRRPVVSLVLAAAILLVFALPLFSMRTGFSGVSTLPEGTLAARGFELLSEEFAGGMASPAEIVIDGDVRGAEVEAAVARLTEALAEDGRFGATGLEVNDAGDLAVVSAPIAADPSSNRAYDAVEDLRESVVPAAFEGVDGVEVLVGGQSAFDVDFFELTRRYTPIVFAFVLGLTFVLLMIVFRSLVVPLKAIVMNLLSVGAAYGLVVFVNQQGHGAGLLGFQQVELIEAWLPLFLFSVLFGLSMDYHVFLLSRIKEHYDETGDNTESVAFGVHSTARIITGAALIMVAVFAGFATGELTMLQQLGFGLAVAVFLDATIVRIILVPATMRLLGDRNWYLPRWLQWLPAVHLERALPPPAGGQSAVGPGAGEPETKPPVLPRR